MTDIVEIERLRAEVLRLSKQGSEDAHSIRTAEDEIERLQQERDQLVDICEKSQASWTTCNEQRSELVRLAELGKSRAEKAEAERDEAVLLWQEWQAAAEKAEAERDALLDQKQYEGKMMSAEFDMRKAAEQRVAELEAQIKAKDEERSNE